METIAADIFKAYDIRGIVDQTLTAEAVCAIGQAIGTQTLAAGHKRIVIGRDGRLSGPKLIVALASGLQMSGCDVIDIGCVTTPMVYFAAFHLNTQCAVVLTGSHNPSNYNGLKMVIAGVTLYGDAIQELRQLIERNELAVGMGAYEQQDVSAAYMARIVSDISLARPMKIAVDCGNGVAGAYVAELYRQLGCTVEELHCTVDGHFPNHHPDPSKPENLRDLIVALRDGDSEIGLAYDGDGDRLGVVSKQGKIIYPDRLLMLYAADVLTRNPGAEIIFDIKSTGKLYDWIRVHGGKPVLWKTGHSLMKAKMQETGSLLAGELSGHIFFKERWYGFDDGLYAGARLLEILSRVGDIDSVLHNLPDTCCTPELHVKTGEGEQHRLMQVLANTARFTNALEIITLDGVRVEYADGFGLARASNTTPTIVLRFEADSEEGLLRIQTDFRRVLLDAEPKLNLPI
ncbi:MAG: phosphomannomutase/phosphoglucomutase [Gallionella sp.]|nr:phosphomannomutase/phosphoglucomutase [Gallionella sp.]